MGFLKLFPAAAEDGNEEYFAINGTKKNIKEIQFSKLPQQEPAAATWVDGGSAVLFSTPSRCIGFLKFCTVKTQAMERKEVMVHSYLVSITRSNGSFVVRNQATKNPIDALDNALHLEIPLESDATPEMLLDVVRQLAEQSLSTEITIHDGSSRSTHPYMQKHSKKMHAIAKTSDLVTSKSRPIGFALLQHAPAGIWYANLTDNMVAVRLHERASHIFLVEQATPELLNLLQAWSADLAFPGYPYPLVLADQLARVTNNERDAWRAIIGSDAEAMKILSGEVKASNAHDVLEHILYGKQM